MITSPGVYARLYVRTVYAFRASTVYRTLYCLHARFGSREETLTGGKRVSNVEEITSRLGATDKEKDIQRKSIAYFGIVYRIAFPLFNTTEKLDRLR